MANQLYIDFDEYIRQGEPEAAQKAIDWRIAIGLQKVDQLETSPFLAETAKRHIEGDINIDEAKSLIRTYYQTRSHKTEDSDNLEEADKVAANIAQILSTQTLSFSTQGYASVHRRIFEGVYKFAGTFRDYDITKKEWVLDGDTVSYLSCNDIRRALDYDIEQERQFSYAQLDQAQIIDHLCRFVSGIWQIHAFGEGNTRTTAVFMIQYLRSIGFDVDNRMFADHSWYFRNALVRANYKNAKNGIDYNTLFLKRFFYNLLLGENYVLKNRYLHIHMSEECQEEWKRILEREQIATSTPTSTPISTPTSTIQRLIDIFGDESLSVSNMMARLGLRDRKNFLQYTLTPAITEGYVCMLYPESPRHPRQQYLLTVKGKMFCTSMKG